MWQPEAVACTPANLSVVLPVNGTLALQLPACCVARQNWYIYVGTYNDQDSVQTNRINYVVDSLFYVAFSVGQLDPLQRAVPVPVPE